MANLFDGANKVKDGVEEIDKILDKLKLTSERLEKIEETFAEMEDLRPELIKIRKGIRAIKSEYDTIDIKTLKEALEKLTNRIFFRWEIWGLYVPFATFLISFGIMGYFYVLNIRRMEQENRVLASRINYVYQAQLLDEKYWYDEASQELYLGDNKWLKEKIREVKKNNKK